MTTRLIIVDDDHNLLKILERKFTTKHFEVDTARDIGEAKDLIEGSAYSVAILDLGFTHLDFTSGLDMVKYVREKSPDTKIIVYTANDSPQVKALAFSNGADLYVLKPVPLEVLLNYVVRLLPE